MTDDDKALVAQLREPWTATTDCATRKINRLLQACRRAAHRIEALANPTTPLAPTDALKVAVEALFGGGFIDAGTRENSEWAQELSRRLAPIRGALAAIRVKEEGHG